jgi:hypothetical protein
MRASKEGHTATVQALIGAGADLNLQRKVRSGIPVTKQTRPTAESCGPRVPGLFLDVLGNVAAILCLLVPQFCTSKGFRRTCFAQKFSGVHTFVGHLAVVAASCIGCATRRIKSGGVTHVLTTFYDTLSRHLVFAVFRI